MKACLTSSALFVCVIGCVAPPKNVGLESESDAGSGTDTFAGTDTLDPSESESESETGAPSGCEQISDAAACDAAQDCAWVEITPIAASPDTCSAFPSREACIRTWYQGDGCEVIPTCGEDDLGVSYWAHRPDLGPDVYDIITPTSLCEDQPVDYDACRWDGDTLLSGPDACTCICEGGMPTLPPIEGELTMQGGCADLLVYAANEASTIALSFYVAAGYAAQAVDTQAPVDVQLEAGGDVEIRLLTGTDIGQQFCTDVPGNVPDAIWTATSGTVELHVEPGEPYPFATVELLDITFEPDDPENGSYHLAGYTFTDVQVGWLPG